MKRTSAKNFVYAIPHILSQPRPKSTISARKKGGGRRIASAAVARALAQAAFLSLRFAASPGSNPPMASSEGEFMTQAV
jgi:hypothetical protein